MKKAADSKFRIVRKGYEQKDVDAYIAKTEADAAAAVEQQKKVIADLEKTISEQRDKIAEYEKKSRRIGEAITAALQKADEIEKLSAYKYVQEMEQLKTFHARWLTYYAKLIKKYPLTEDLQAVQNFNDKVNRILGAKTEAASPADGEGNRFREEFSRLIRQNGELDDLSQDDDIPSFERQTFMKLPEDEVKPAKTQYKSSRVNAPLPAGEGESGFSFEEALNPKESLEEIMADLGLLMGDDDSSGSKQDKNDKNA